jgi:hypothetical protein
MDQQGPKGSNSLHDCQDMGRHMESDGDEVMSIRGCFVRWWAGVFMHTCVTCCRVACRCCSAIEAVSEGDIGICRMQGGYAALDTLLLVV